ncbi:endonuclease VIII [Gammaproteobacteria bacterium]|jgi:endonuclease-8|nr:endonuclease VIII [Gammaproteobacteria bacterium]
MPEGPEIRLAADRIGRILAGKTIEDVALTLAPLRRFEKRLRGKQVTAVDTRGKAMLTRFSNGLTLYSHNQLYGRWFTTRRPKLPKTGRQLRVALHTATHSALLYSASEIEVLTDRQLAAHPFLSRLGPDILDPALTVEQVSKRLNSAPFRNRGLGGLYLDQSFLAGNGNYLRSEILWAAKVNPAHKPSMLDPEALNRVARETLKISRRSYRTRGITVPQSLVRDLKAQGLTYQGYRFHAFGRDGLPCYRCGTPIERRILGSRNLFVCYHCQAS